MDRWMDRVSHSLVFVQYHNRPSLSLSLSLTLSLSHSKKNKHIATQFKLNRALEEAKSVVVVGSTKDFNKSFCNRKTTKQEENPQKLFKRQTRTNGLDYFQNYSR